MREMKFRAWNIKKDCWVEHEIFVGAGGGVGFWNNKGTAELIVLDDIELTQFTGLLDKNGKEIYEGDVVTVCGRNIEIYWCPSEACWCIDKQSAETVETIGNIYENPELLKGATP